MIGDVHEFAFYAPIVSSIVQRSAHQDIYELIEPDLIHRIATVLRLEKGERCILFDTKYHIKGTILCIEPKKKIVIEFHSIEPNRILNPHITWVLPLLKREAFEESLYSLTQMAAQVIQPILTQKTSKLWQNEKDAIRTQKIMISAAEQAKQFAIPSVMPILPFDVWLAQLQKTPGKRLFFDAQGQGAKNIISSLWVERPDHIIAVTGPEGDLSAIEKEMLREQQFTFCALTPTILRAQQAIAVGLGLLRSLL